MVRSRALMVTGKMVSLIWESGSALSADRRSRRRRHVGFATTCGTSSRKRRLVLTPRALGDYDRLCQGHSLTGPGRPTRVSSHLECVLFSAFVGSLSCPHGEHLSHVQHLYCLVKQTWEFTHQRA